MISGVMNTGEQHIDRGGNEDLHIRLKSASRVKSPWWNMIERASDPSAQR